MTNYAAIMTSQPVKTSTRGPKLLTAIGALCLVGAVVVAVIVVRLFLSVVPFGITSADGGPGNNAVGGVEVPGEVTLTLDGDTTYAVYLAHPSAADGIVLADRVTVTGPGGAEVARVAGASDHSTTNSVSAESLFTFRTGSAGEYTVDAPPLAGPAATPWAQVIVAPQKALGGFLGSLFGTIAGVFVTIGLAGAGVVMVLIGGIWWYTRSKARKQLQRGQWSPGPNQPDLSRQPGPPQNWPGPQQQYGPGPPYRP